jgi:small subunit ribosomal protein S1
VIGKNDDREPAEPSATEPTPESSDRNGSSDRAIAASPEDESDSGDEPVAAEDAPEPPQEAAPPGQDEEASAETATETGGEEQGEREKQIPESDGSAKRPARPRMSRSRQMRLASLFRAFRSGRPLEGTVEGAIKGGYEVKLGKVRAFCPHSQIDLQRADDPAAHVGEQYLFRITQLRRGGDDIVVSRRAILEDERKEEAKAVRATLIEGAVMQGRVAGIAEFGAFVDLGAGVMGLVHVSELAHTRVTRVGDAVKVGDLLRVKVLKLDDKSQRISLSARLAQEDPWAEVPGRIAVGAVYPGEIKRVTDFGAFVELLPGVEALAPASEFPPSRSDWREGLSSGATRDWLVLSVDAEGRRISVTPPVEGKRLEELPPLVVGGRTEGRVQRVERYGVFVWLGPGRVGLMPSAWSGTPRGEDLSRRFPIGESVEVDVVEVAEDGKRIRLAKAGVKIEPESPRRTARRTPAGQGKTSRAGREESQRPAGEQSGEGFGTILADKLRAALERPDDDS